MWISSRLDFIEAENDKTGPLCLFGLAFVVIMCGNSWVLAFLWSNVTKYPQWLQNTNLLEGFFIRLPMAIIGLISIVIQVVWSITFTIGTIGLFIGGLLCLPRAVVFLTTTHRVRAVWEKGKATGDFSPEGVVGGLGQTSQSKAHARALLKKAETLKKEVEVRERQMRQEADRLSKEINDDTVRLEMEAEIAQKMTKIEQLRIEIEEMRKFQEK